MMGFHPFAQPFVDRNAFIRPPPRTPSPPAAPEPHVETFEEADAYVITVRSPDEDHVLQDSRAHIDGQQIVVEGTLASSVIDGMYEYRTRGRAGIYTHPSRHALAGIVPPGRLVRGTRPSNAGWVALDDDESFMLDDGSLVLVGRPADAGPHPFAKRVRLPADAELRRATTAPWRHGHGGGLRVTVPRARRRANAPAPRHVPINVKRSDPQARAAPAPAPAVQPPPSSTTAKYRKPAAASTTKVPTPTPSADVSADEYKQQHKRQAAERRSQAMHEALLSKDEAGPVLSEVAASERHVQSPTEDIEEWVAAPSGGFVKGGEGEHFEQVEMATAADESYSEDEGLAFYGF